MARPKKLRKVSVIPKFKNFKPSGIKCNDLEKITLKIEELEALKLRDIDKLEQAACAKKMEVSRQTFQLIIKKAHEKVSTSLIEGRCLTIEGGDFIRKNTSYDCPKCGKKHAIKKKQAHMHCTKENK